MVKSEGDENNASATPFLPKAIILGQFVYNFDAHFCAALSPFTNRLI